MAKLSQLTIPVKNTSTGQVTSQTFDISGSGGDSKNFKGTRQEWDALSQSEKDAYDTLDLEGEFYSYPLDTALDPTSENAITNKAVALFVGKKLTPQTLEAGETTLTFTDSSITTDSTVEEYYSIRGVCATEVTVTAGQVVMTFEALETDLSVYLIIR